ncbi:MAG: hypothetical protein U5R14_04455 [Gemmatimonadota bacterium]|nr:hypothetical protein [Gemmatimonadota bacterium]
MSGKRVTRNTLGPPRRWLLTGALLAPALAATGAVGGCSLASAGPPGAGNASAEQGLPPPGFGTLSQREVSLTLTSGTLRILVTPLAESVLVTTAPDTYRRLSALAEPHRTRADDTAIFLVSFFSDQPDVRFVPQEVQFVSGGVRVRPSSVTPVTPGWGSGRVAQRGTETAVYVFDRPLDLESDLTLHYGLERTDAWRVILSRIQAERARARARAG